MKNITWNGKMKEKNGRGTDSQGINTHDSQLSKEERLLEKEKIMSSVSDTLNQKQWNKHYIEL